MEEIAALHAELLKPVASAETAAALWAAISQVFECFTVVVVNPNRR